MADLAVSLTKSVVEGAVTKALSAIEEEARLRLSTQTDLVFITGEFQMMQSFLNVADEERVRNNVVRTWVRQVRDLAYNVEDCIEYVIHLDKASDCCCRCLSLCLPSFMRPELPLDKAVAEIKQLKGRVEEVSLRNMRYNLISDSGSKPVTQQQLVPAASVEAATSDMLTEARDTAKMQRGLGDLTKLITKNVVGAEIGVISVWGAGGYPDTTPIIREAYGEPEICESFKCRGWAKLTHPFNPHEFQRSLLIQFHTNSCRQNEPSEDNVHTLKRLEEASQGGLIKEFMEKMKKERYLVVLENLSSMVEWDTVRAYLPDGKNGSWIIISTSQSEIARLCVGHPWQVLELNQYSATHSVCVFFREGSEGNGNIRRQTNLAMPSTSDTPSVDGVRHKGGYALYASIPTSKNNADMWGNRFPLVEARKSQMNDLRGYLAKARVGGYPVISVWGIAGVGKSALVRNLYYNMMRDRENQTFTKYSWVDVSHPFNIRNFAWSLQSEFQSDSIQQIVISNPIQGCRQLLEDDVCLIVVDGLQSTEEWDLIRHSLVPKHSKSIIVVITTEESIAMHCATREEGMYNVKSLEGDEATDLFRKEVRMLEGSDALRDSQDPELRKLILKCGGLPKVILAIPDILAPMTVNWMNSALNMSKRFMHDLETKPEFDNLRGLFGWMHSYFRTCPDFLKPCILYLSIFPQDQSIRRRRIVRRWIAEGYSRDTSNRSAEENGEKFFSMLLSLSIVQQTPHSTTTAETRMVWCQVNSFFREYIISRRKDEDLVFELEGRCTLTTQRTGRHLVIKESWDRDKIVFDSIDFSRLRSLTVFGEWKPFFISESMKVLRVLDLENAAGVTYKYLEQMLRLLSRLKFLSLRGRKEIRHLPSSFGALRQLETLDVRGTNIAELPPSITKLKKLQYIRAGRTITEGEISTPCALLSWLSAPCRAGPVCGVEVPTGIEKLTALHTIGVLNAGLLRGKAILKEIKKLTQLHKLGVTGISNKNCKVLCSAISYHAHLESLSVWLNRGSGHCLDKVSMPQQKPLANLRSLKLYGLLEVVPSWIKDLPKLTKLVLHMTISEKSDISKVLGEMEELLILRLCVKLLDNGNGKLDFHVMMNGVPNRCYKKVKILDISCSSNLTVTFGSEAMENLELLTVRCSNGSTWQFPELQSLSKLKKVRLIGSNNNELQRQLRIQLNNHPMKPDVEVDRTAGTVTGLSTQPSAGLTSRC
ncbi:unnamed protein product [Urochloa decumbens]|uniref:Disease resistance protein RPM1 n=1 Tax=Urochloa decumbens TaxID=240449 RepID=A0ABC9B499_9POAL